MATGIYCRRCDYDLRGQVAGTEKRCPECGRGFDPGNPKTFRTRPLRYPLGKWIKLAAMGLLVVLVLGGGAWGWLYWGWHREQTARATLRADAWHVQPLGGSRLRGYLGPAGFVLDRVRGLVLLKTYPNRRG